MTKNGKKGPAPKKQEAKTPSTLIGAKPERMLTVSAPVAKQLVKGRGQYVKVMNRERRSDGLEYVTVKFHQLLQRAILRNNGSQVLADANGNPSPGVPVNPYFIGGLLAKTAVPYNSFKFEELKAYYVAGASTQQPATIALGYLPSYDLADSVMRDESEGGVISGLFRAITALASNATAPVWGEIALEVGKRFGAPLAEAALKWFSNYKVSTASVEEADDEFSLDKLQQQVVTYVNALDGFLVANAATLPLGTRPTVPVPLIPIATSRDRRMADMRHRSMTLLGTGLRETTQGILLASADGPYTGPVDANGIAPAGEIFVEGTVIFCAVSDTSTAQSAIYGDPLDVEDPVDHLHSSYNPTDRFRYVISKFVDNTEFDFKDRFSRTIDGRFLGSTLQVCSHKISDDRSMVEVLLPGDRSVRVIIAKSFCGAVARAQSMMNGFIDRPISLRMRNLLLDEGVDLAGIVSGPPRQSVDERAALSVLNTALGKNGYEPISEGASSSDVPIILTDRFCRAPPPPTLLASARYFFQTVGIPEKDIRLMEERAGFYA